METQNFDNDTRTLTLVKVSELKSALYSHTFTVSFNDDDEEEDDKVSINVNRSNDFGSWLEDNCDIEGTEGNIELLKTLLK